MDLNHYVFDSRWPLHADADEVFAVLSDIASYPQWWPEIRQVRRLDEDTESLVIRSFLPYSLTLNLRQTRLDRGAGVIEASLEGDLDGTSRWTLSSAGDGRTVAQYHEDVVARKRLLRLLAPIAHPIFRANHALAERGGRRGLAAYLAARRETPQP